MADLTRKNRASVWQAALIDLLKVLLKLKCEEHDVAPKLVAGSDDLEAIAMDDDADVPALRSWRRDVFGSAALDVKAGRLGFTYDPGAQSLKLVKPA